MFKTVLSEAKESGVPISLYTDKEDTARFAFGFVLGLSDDAVLIGSITPYGFYDGYTVRRLQDIYRVERGDRYGCRLLKLYALHDQLHPSLPLTGDLFRDVLSFSRKSRLAVSIELMDSDCDDVQGFVSDVQGMAAVIEQVSDDGEPDGETVIAVGDITCITCDAEKETALKLLFESRPPREG